MLMILLFVAGLSSMLVAEPLIKVGIIDLNRIMSTYFRDSAAMRDYNAMVATFQADITKMQSDIAALEAKKVEAAKRGEDETALSLDKQIFDKKQFLQDYYKVKKSQLDDYYRKLTESSGFLNEILSEINFISESQGYSIILKSDDPYLVFYTKEADITDLVLQRLQKRAQTR